MGLFGKPRISAEEAGTRFVHESLVIARDRWPSVRQDLRPALAMLQLPVEFLTDDWTEFYFALSALGCELQAARNLLKEPIRSRAIAAAMASLAASKTVGNIATELVTAVDRQWKESLTTGEDPSPAVPLLQALGLDFSTEMLGQRVYSPLALMALDTAVLQLSNGWWRQFLEKHEVR